MTLSRTTLLTLTLTLNCFTARTINAAETTPSARKSHPYAYPAAMACASACALYGGLKTDNYALAGAGLGIALGTTVGMLRNRLNKWVIYIGTPIATTSAAATIAERLEIHEDDISGYAARSVERTARLIQRRNPGMSLAACREQARRHYAAMVMIGAAIPSSIAAYYATKYMTPEKEPVK